jgi:tetratricopeptide (TPR) repeat protein
MFLGNGTRRKGVLAVLGLTALGVAVVSIRAQRTDDARLWSLRNLGKAFYENPTTQKQAVEQFRQALALAPNSVREQVNYGLALLKGGEVEAGLAQLEKAQKADPKLPHTWFNLGVAYQKQADFDRAFTEFEGMARLVPDEPVTHYHLGALYKMKGDQAAAIREFETAARLNPRLAAPHFQLYNLNRQADRADDAARELRTFQDLKKEQEGAAVPEDMDWSWWAEIYDPSDAFPQTRLTPPVYRDDKIADGFDGVTTLLLDDGTRPSLIAWSREHVAVFRYGTERLSGTGLESLRDVVFIAPGDFDNDGLPDLLVITTKGAELWRNDKGKFRKQADLAAGSFRKALWIDYDHDYDPDLVLVGEDSRLLRNDGASGFSDQTKRFPFVAARATDLARVDTPDLTTFDFVVAYENHAPVLYHDKLGGVYEAKSDSAGQRPTLPIAADFRGNGRADLALIRDHALFLRRDITPNYGNWSEIALTGVKNSKLALDAQVEVKAGDSYQRALYQGIPLVFRLGGRTQIDTIRITWPNGLIQNETQRPVNHIEEIKEAPRLSGSCPMIFTWNGGRFEFITDVLGVAPLGASSGDGEYFPVNDHEYVSIPGESLRARDGFYEIRVAEELREVSYLDQIKLIALDHPADTGIVTNEKFKSPPFPEFRLFGVKRRVYPVAAHDDQGRDVLPAIVKRDHLYPDGFRRDQAGVAEMHTLDLKFDAVPGNAVLILNGWVDWADGSTFLGHPELTFPYLQARGANGEWKTIVQDMGIPAGKPKTIAVPVGGARDLRLVTNLCVYWDEIFLTDSDTAPETRMTTVPLRSADLHFRGFSRATIDPERRQPEQFEYSRVNYLPMWNPTAGKYTRYGAVEKLLSDADDRLVVMGSGDEVALRYEAAALPDLPTGWKRDFLLLVSGWAKDADPNTAFSQTVLPLPFHEMKRYGDPFPGDTPELTRPALRLVRRLSE